MKIEVMLTDRQAEKIAEFIIQNNFFICGIGHFNLPIDEYKNFIKCCFGKNPDKELRELYAKYQLR